MSVGDDWDVVALQGSDIVLQRSYSLDYKAYITAATIAETRANELIKRRADAKTVRNEINTHMEKLLNNTQSDESYDDLFEEIKQLTAIHANHQRRIVELEKMAADNNPISCQDDDVKEYITLHNKELMMFGGTYFVWIMDSCIVIDHNSDDYKCVILEDSDETAVTKCDIDLTWNINHAGEELLSCPIVVYYMPNPNKQDNIDRLGQDLGRGGCGIGLNVSNFECVRWKDIVYVIGDSINKQIYQITCKRECICTTSSERFKTWMYNYALAANDIGIYMTGGQETEGGAATTDTVIIDPVKLNTYMLPNMNMGRTHHQSCIVDNNLYALGGYSSNMRNYLDSMELLDLNNIASWWKMCEPMPNKRAQFAAVVHGRQIWVIGGTSNCKGDGLVDIYDVDTKSWTCGPPIPEYTCDGSAISDGSIIRYIAGNGRYCNIYTIDTSHNEAEWMCFHTVATKTNRIRVA